MKFSVKGESSVEFVSLFMPKSSHKIVQCHSSICSISKSCKREVNLLNDPKVNLCDHLRIFKEYLDDHREILEQCNEAQNESEDGFLPSDKVSFLWNTLL